MRKKVLAYTVVAVASASGLYLNKSYQPVAGSLHLSSESGDVSAEYATSMGNIVKALPQLQNSIFSNVGDMATAMVNLIPPGQGAILIEYVGRSAIGYRITRGSNTPTLGPVEEAAVLPAVIVDHAIEMAEPEIRALSEKGGGIAFIGAGATEMGVGEFVAAIEEPKFKKMLAKYPNVQVVEWGTVAHQAGLWGDKLYNMKMLTLIKDPTGYWEVVINGISQTPTINIEFAKRGYRAPFIIVEGGKVAVNEALQLLFLIKDGALKSGESLHDFAAKVPVTIQIGLAPGQSKGQLAGEKGVDAGYEFLSSLYEMANANKAFADSLGDFDIKAQLYDGELANKKGEVAIKDLASLKNALSKANNLKIVQRRLEKINGFYDEVVKLADKVTMNELNDNQRELVRKYRAENPNANDFKVAAYLHAVQNHYHSSVDKKAIKELSLEQVKNRAANLKAVEYLKLNSVVKNELNRLSTSIDLHSDVTSELKTISSSLQSGKTPDGIRVSKGLKTHEAEKGIGERAAGKAKK